MSATRLSAVSDLVSSGNPSHTSSRLFVLLVMTRVMLPFLPSATKSTLTRAFLGGLSPPALRMKAFSESGCSMVPVRAS